MNYDHTSNPVFKDNVFYPQDSQALAMTIDGVIRKSFVTLFLLLAGAAFAWTRSYATVEEIGGKIVLFSIGTLVLYFITMFKPDVARITVPLYAIGEGFIIGAISWLAQRRYPGIVVQAATGTFGVFAAMLFAYKTGIIRLTEKFATVLFVATAGVAFIYFASWIMSFFGSPGLSIIHSSSNFSIGFSVVVCIIAALNLLIDFEFITHQSKIGAPEKMEWIAALGLLVTLVWIYMEVLRLLMKLKARND
ncbi:MAG: Bax inhibitor-1/YccA family protein [Puniceicoccales bacterium]|jgi:uncharacterized YccA/Bax inhibitor family protein|nr:Bax inhibitor-1/YccA family protein [Puniceicoccales bacterium]